MNKFTDNEGDCSHCISTQLLRQCFFFLFYFIIVGVLHLCNKSRSFLITTMTRHSAITLKQLTGDVNNVDDLVTMAPVKRWQILASK